MKILCRIEMFGQLKVIRGDQEQTRFRTHKIGWILAYLALHREQSVPRERLLDLFWPEMDVETGRSNLNNALSSLRRQLELPRDGILVADRQNVRLDPEFVQTDVNEFQELLTAASRTPDYPERASLLERAVGLYRGDLLPGCYEEWAVQEQQRLHGLHAEALGQWSELLDTAGEFTEALAVAKRAVLADIYREEFHRRQMRLQAVLGQPTAALESYREMERRFADELGAAPSAATRELARQIREDPERFALSPRPANLAAKPTITRAEAMPVADESQPSHSQAAAPSYLEPIVSQLPLVLTRYFGRAEEQTALAGLLTSPDTRLVTLLGPGGAGKTRLSVEVARQLSPVFAGRVWWVSLADIPDARLISSALSRALHISNAGAADPMDAVIARLNEAPCLLVLDNMEHLLRDDVSGSAKGDQSMLDTATAIVRLLLERAPRLRCLVTSRRTLRLGGEQEYPLPPLPVPLVSSLPEEVLKSPSVALYADRARLARPDFAVTPNNAETIARLCRKLEGMPLSIEMAAAWAKVLPPAKMLERLEERVDALTTLAGRRRDLPARHQSLRATIDWSYDLLDAGQKRMLARLSVFRGGWSLEAAESVCAAGIGQDVDVLDLLTSLVDKSLVVSEVGDDEPRYRLLETVRQYGRDRLEESGETDAIHARHFAYFLQIVESSTTRLRGGGQAECLDQFEREHDNLRAAMTWARTDEGRQLAGAEAELDMAGRLRPFWDMRGYWREGRERLTAAMAAIETGPQPSDPWTRALLGAGVLAANVEDYITACRYYEQSLTLELASGGKKGIGSVCMALGHIAVKQRRFSEAHSWFEQGLEAAALSSDNWTRATLLMHLSILADREGDKPACDRYANEALSLRRQIGDLLGVASLQHNLGVRYVDQGDMSAGYSALEECLTILQRVGERRFTALAIEQFAYTELLQTRIANGVRFIASAQRIREETGVPPSPTVEENLSEARQELGDEAFAAAQALGRSMGREQAIAEALITIANIRLEKR